MVFFPPSSPRPNLRTSICLACMARQRSGSMRTTRLTTPRSPRRDQPHDEGPGLFVLVGISLLIGFGLARLLIAAADQRGDMAAYARMLLLPASTLSPGPTSTHIPTCTVTTTPTHTTTYTPASTSTYTPTFTATPTGTRPTATASNTPTS